MIMSWECKTSVITSFTASPTTITAGQSSTLSWASNGDKCIVKESGRPAIGTMIVSPTVTTNYDITCYNGSVASVGKIVTVNVASGTYSGSTTNPYASTLSAPVQKIVDTWITKNISKYVIGECPINAQCFAPTRYTIPVEDYIKILDTIIAKLGQIKSATPSSNKSKLNVINYLNYELQKKRNNINIDDATSFLDSLK